MDMGAHVLPPLEALLRRLKKREETLWGRVQGWSHQWLSRLEVHPLFRKYATLPRRSRGVIGLRSDPRIDLDSLFFLSLLFHLLVFFLLTRFTYSSAPGDKPEPILVRIVEGGVESKREQSERPKTAERKPVRAAKKQPRPSSPSVAVEEKPATPTAVTPAPSLPVPKVLAEAPREKATGLTGAAVETLVQLPTRQSAGGQRVTGGAGEPVSGTGAGEGASIPEGLRRGDPIGRTAGKGTGSSGAALSPDFAPYLRMIEKRVRSVWKYPEGASGSHMVEMRFVLDRAGNLVRVELLRPTDPRLDVSAVEAMKRASPFPPMPDSLKELAGEMLRINFKVDLGVKGTR